MSIREKMVASPFAMCAGWGPELTLIYNDVYVDFLADRHPGALGRPIAKVWHDTAPLVERAMARESVHHTNMHLALCGWVSLTGSGLPTEERAVIVFFGIRGLGAMYCVAYAFGHPPFEAPDTLSTKVGLAVLVSIVMHGITVTPVLRFLDHRSGRETESG